MENKTRGEPMTYADLLNKLIEENKALLLENEQLKRDIERAARCNSTEQLSEE